MYSYMASFLGSCLCYYRKQMLARAKADLQGMETGEADWDVNGYDIALAKREIAQLEDHGCLSHSTERKSWGGP